MNNLRSVGASGPSKVMTSLKIFSKTHSGWVDQEQQGPGRKNSKTPFVVISDCGLGCGRGQVIIWLNGCVV